MSKFFIRRPIVAMVISIVMVIVGVVSMLSLPTSQFPNIVPPEILVRWKYFLPVLGISICLIETGYPVFIWLKKTRMIWLICVLGMHFAIGFTMGMYLFALIMIVLNIAAFGPDFSVTETNGYVGGGRECVPV